MGQTLRCGSSGISGRCVRVAESPQRTQFERSQRANIWPAEAAAEGDRRAGGHQFGLTSTEDRPTRHLLPLTLNLIEIGARPYDPFTGRFLTTDPIEGGSRNNYDYAPRPSQRLRPGSTWRLADDGLDRGSPGFRVYGCCPEQGDADALAARCSSRPCIVKARRSSPDVLTEIPHSELSDPGCQPIPHDARIRGRWLHPESSLQQFSRDSRQGVLRTRCSSGTGTW